MCLCLDSIRKGCYMILDSSGQSFRRCYGKKRLMLLRKAKEITRNRLEFMNSMFLFIRMFCQTVTAINRFRCITACVCGYCYCVFLAYIMNHNINTIFSVIFFFFFNHQCCRSDFLKLTEIINEWSIQQFSWQIRHYWSVSSY